ncbi:hypothetical protein NL676_003732 [Syzygium grande]|nr:hypothetical protein NL676_003732 [Syzygium grande]
MASFSYCGLADPGGSLSAPKASVVTMTPVTLAHASWRDLHDYWPQASLPVIPALGCHSGNLGLGCITWEALNGNSCLVHAIPRMGLGI